MVEELPVIDLMLGAKLLESDEQVAKDMIKELIASLPGDLQKLKNAYLNQDIEKIAELAHYLHGGACFCGTPRLKIAARELEKQSKVSQSFAELQVSYTRLCQEITAVIGYGPQLFPPTN